MKVYILSRVDYSYNEIDSTTLGVYTSFDEATVAANDDLLRPLEKNSWYEILKRSWDKDWRKGIRWYRDTQELVKWAERKPEVYGGLSYEIEESELKNVSV